MKKYFDSVINANTGRAVAGATVSFLDSAGNPIVTYADEAFAGAAITTTTDENGLFQRYVPNGVYTVRQTYGNVTVEVPGVEIFDDEQQEFAITRALLVPEGETGVILPEIGARAGKYLVFDANGAPAISDGSGADAALRTDLAVTGGASLVGFTQSGTGAALRSVEDKLRDVVSVKDFGAVGDGVTDDTAAIAAAVSAANTLAVTNGHCTLSFPDGDYIVDVATGSMQTTAWRILFPVGDNVTITGPGRVISSTSFADKTVIFAVRGDNVSFIGLKMRDTYTAGNPWSVAIGWGDTYDDGLAAKTYTSLTVKDCELEKHWLSLSCQTKVSTASLMSGVRVENVRAWRASSVTSAGCYNFRTEDPGAISDVHMVGNVGEYGPTAAVYNFYGVHGIVGSGNTQIGATVYAGAEFEKGCQDVIWDGFRSEATDKSVWIDQSKNISVGGYYMAGSFYITAETGVVEDIHIGSGIARTFSIPNFGTYVDGIVRNVFVNGLMLMGGGTNAVFIQGQRVQSAYLKNVNISPGSTYTNRISIARNAAMGLVEIDGGNIDIANISESSTGGKITIAGVLKSSGTARQSIAGTANANLTFQLPSISTSRASGGKIFFTSRDATAGDGAVFEALFRIAREGGSASVVIGSPINTVGLASAYAVTLAASVNTDGSELTVNVTNNNAANTLQIRGYCQHASGTTAP